MIGRIIAIFLCFLNATLVHAQDPTFSQFYANPIYLNPTLAGTADGNRVVVNHRQQWRKPISYITSAISIDGSFNTTKTGWGFQLINDNKASGQLIESSFTTSLAHRIEMSKGKYIGLGIKIGAYQKRIDWSNLVFEDQIDKRNGPVNSTNERFGKNKVVNAEAAAGVLYLSETIIAGIAVHHLNRPLEEFSAGSSQRLDPKYTAHVGGFIDISTLYSEQFIYPNLIYERQGKFEYINIGMYYGVNNFTMGINYRLQDAIIGLLGFTHKDFKFGYSYDVTISRVGNGQNNSHEISLSYLFQLPKKFNKKGRYKGQCPKHYKYLL